MHPHLFFDEYDIAIWIDASIIVLKDIYPMLEEFLLSKLPIAFTEHPDRRDVFSECEAVIKHKRDDARVVNKQKIKYMQLGFNHNNLVQTGLIMFNLRNKKLKGFLDIWWKECNTLSKRDQLSVNFAISISKINYFKLIRHPQSLTTDSRFTYIKHGSLSYLTKKLISKVQKRVIDPYSKVGFTKSYKKIPFSVNIIIWGHENNLEHLEKCLNSIKNNTGDRDYKIVIILSKIDLDISTKKDIKSTFQCEIIYCKKDVEYIEMINKFLTSSKSDLSVVLKSDTIVNKNWIEKLHLVATSHKEIGIVGPLSNVFHLSNMNTRYPDNGEKINQCCEEVASNNIWPYTSFIYPTCFVLTKGVIKRVGIFNILLADSFMATVHDYLLRAQNQGFLTALAINTFVFHLNLEDDKYLNQNYLNNDLFIKSYDIYRPERSIKSLKKNPLLKRFKDSLQEKMELTHI